ARISALRAVGGAEVLPPYPTTTTAEWLAARPCGKSSVPSSMRSDQSTFPVAVLYPRTKMSELFGTMLLYPSTKELIPALAVNTLVLMLFAKGVWSAQRTLPLAL